MAETHIPDHAERRLDELTCIPPAANAGPQGPLVHRLPADPEAGDPQPRRDLPGQESLVAGLHAQFTTEPLPDSPDL